MRAGPQPRSRHHLTPAWVGLRSTRRRLLGPVRPVSGQCSVHLLHAVHPLPEPGTRRSHRPACSCIGPGQAWWRIASASCYDHFLIYPPDTHIGMDSVLSRFAPFARFTTFLPLDHPSYLRPRWPLHRPHIPSHSPAWPDSFLFRPHRPASACTGSSRFMVYRLGLPR